MDIDLEKQYDNYFRIFSTKGWKQFIEDMQDVYDNYRIEDIKDEIQLAQVQGERKILWQVLKFEESLRHAYDSHIEDTDD